MQNDIVKKLVWSGVLATVGAISAVIARKAAELLDFRGEK